MEAISWDGKPISKPGLYRNIPLAIYHSANICDGPSVSSSGLRRIDPDNDGSPAHFYAEWSGNPNRKEESDARHFVIGRAVHHLLLGEKWFARLFVIRPEEYPDRKVSNVMKPWHSNRLECRAWLDQQAKLGKSVLKAEDVENVKGMAQGLARLPLVRSGVLNGQIERSIFYRDKATGVWIKVRPDAIPTGSGDYSDLKTTTSVQWRNLTKSITDFKYHQQGALIRTAAVEVLGIPKESFTFTLVFVEKEQPWCGRTVQLKPDDLDMGERQNRKALDIFASCLKSGNWPGPGENDDAPYIDLQDYYRSRINERLGAS